MPKPVHLSQAIRSWVDASTNHSLRGWSHHAKASGLSMPQFGILMQLFYSHNCGISDLSERFEISAAAASQHVENLVMAGLIERAEDPHDRRAKQIQLSPKGKAIIEKGMSAYYYWVGQLVTAVEEKDQAKVSAGLVILNEAARKLDQAK